MKNGTLKLFHCRNCGNVATARNWTGSKPDCGVCGRNDWELDQEYEVIAETVELGNFPRPRGLAS